MDRLSPLCKVESVWRTKPASLKPHPTTKLKWNTKNFISATHKVKSQSNYFVIVATRTAILRMWNSLRLKKIKYFFLNAHNQLMLLFVTMRIKPWPRNMAKRAAPTVLFNESCPICSAEIGHYKKISAEQNLDLDFCAITDADLSEWGLTSTQALQRLYLRKDDKVFSGVDAFLAIWDCLPGFRILAKIIALPIIYGGAVFIYDRILAPLLYKWHQRRGWLFVIFPPAWKIFHPFAPGFIRPCF